MKKGYGRNYWALTTEGAIFTGGIVILSTGGPVALFINTMTGSNTLIGFAVTIQALFVIFGNLLSAPLINAIRKLPEFLVKVMLIHRIIPLLFAIPLFLGVSGYSSVIIFLVLFAVFWFIDGTITLPWGELCARALKPELRGHMMGMQGTIGSVASMLVGLLLTWLIATPLLSDEHRFAFIFALASAILLMTVICIRLVRDPNPIMTPEKPDIMKFYAQIPSVLRKCKLLRYAIIARMPSYLGFAATSFLIVFGVSTLDLSDLQVSLLVYSIIIGGIIGGVTSAEASRRLGNRAIILLSNFCVVVAVCMAILLAYVPSLGYIWLFAICVLGSISLNNWIGYFNYFIDIAPVENRSAYQLLGQAVGIPFSFAGLAMGAVVDRFGFVVMFVICGIFAVAAVLLSLKLLSKREVEDRVEVELQLNQKQ